MNPASEFVFKYPAYSLLEIFGRRHGGNQPYTGLPFRMIIHGHERTQNESHILKPSVLLEQQHKALKLRLQNDRTVLCAGKQSADLRTHPVSTAGLLDILQDSGEYYILEAIEEDGEPQLAEVIDENLRQRLANIFEERFNEMFYED